MRMWLPVWLCVLALLRTMVEPEPPPPKRALPAAPSAVTEARARIPPLAPREDSGDGSCGMRSFQTPGTSRQISPHVYEVTGWPEGRCSRMVPAGTGFKIGCRYDGWGIEAGDTLLSVNGFTFRDPEDALETYAALRGATRFEVVLERAGHRITNVYLLHPRE